MLALASHEYSALALAVIDYASLLTCQASVDSWAYFLAVAPLSPHVFSSMRRKLKFWGRNRQVLTCAVVAFAVFACVHARARSNRASARSLLFLSPSLPPPPACTVYLDRRRTVFCPWLKRVLCTGDDDLDDALSDVDEVPKSKKKKKAKKSSRESRSSKRQRPIREVSFF